jgi:hypothetical protein
MRGKTTADVARDVLNFDFRDPMPSPCDMVRTVVDAAIENFRDPAYRVEFTAGVIAAALLASSRRRLTFLPSLLIAAATGKAARWAYVSVEDIRASRGIGLAILEDLNRYGVRLPSTGASTSKAAAGEAGDVRPG